MIGSRLVFLIDWNKARKRLLRFFENDDAVALLKWAADEDVGHRGFLQLGGERLIYDAVEAASGGQVRYGESLQDMLGEEQAEGFVRFVLRAASAGLSQGRSESLIRDQIRAELLNHLQSREQHLLDLSLDHAGFVLQIADAVREAIAILGTPAAAAGAERQARRAKAWERSADDKLIALRERAHGKAEAVALRRIVETADDAADDLEDAAYTISLFPGTAPTAKFQQPLQQMAALLVEAGREWNKALANAARLHRQSAREEADDFFVAIDGLARIERDTDRVQRRVTAALIAGNPEYREFYLVTEIARHLEEAADSLMRAAMLLHDNVLGHMMTK